MSNPFIKSAFAEYLERRQKDTPKFGTKPEHLEQLFRAGWKARAERDTLMRHTPPRASKSKGTP